MVCYKCGYKDKKEKIIFGKLFCQICAKFSPAEAQNFQKYVEEKIDWKTLDTFRKYNQTFGEAQKEGMERKAGDGFVVSRAPLGYRIENGSLIQDENASRVHSLFKTFLARKYSLNSLAKNFSLSVNGLKKVLSNRTYLGEIKFNGKIFKGTHKPIISQEIFYAVQRKLKEYERKRKKS